MKGIDNKQIQENKCDTFDIIHFHDIVRKFSYFRASKRIGAFFAGRSQDSIIC